MANLMVYTGPACIVCGTPGPKNRWENIRAQNAGWFFQRNGDMYCPNDVPDWVAEWRAERDAANRDNH